MVPQAIEEVCRYYFDAVRDELACLPAPRRPRLIEVRDLTPMDRTALALWIMPDLKERLAVWVVHDRGDAAAARQYGPSAATGLPAFQRDFDVPGGRGFYPRAGLRRHP